MGNRMMQKTVAIGQFLSQSTMPNISAFMAWGFMTALFTENGWVPSVQLDQMIEPTMRFALPLMIAYTGGRRYGGERGAAIGMFATMGLIVGVDIPMIFGAMLMGPFTGWLLKWFEEIIEGRIPLGFEMLSRNLVAAVFGLALCLINFFAIGPLVSALNTVLVQGVSFALSRGLLFFSAILIEPAKVLFLNNAINHGVLSPIGLQMSVKEGSSLLFLLETNPGPGLGVLLAYALFGPKESKKTALPASVIHLLGGIHEIYFPYVLMQPILMVSLVLSGLVGNFYFQIHQVGLVATPSPGSLLAILTLTQKAALGHLLIGLTLSVVSAFVTSSLLLRYSNRQVNLREGKTRQVAPSTQVVAGVQKRFIFDQMHTQLKQDQIFVACDAGMGSSALGAAMITRVFAQRGIVASVNNVSLEHLPASATLVITYKSLMERARSKAPRASILGISDFLDKDAYEEAIDMMQDVLTIRHNPVLKKENIFVNLPSVTKEAAIMAAGQCLYESGYVEEAYIQGMLAREVKFSTYIGSGVAIPHGENTVKQYVKTSGIVVFQYPQGVAFADEKLAYLVIGIAGLGNDHIHILSNIAEVIEDDTQLATLCTTHDIDVIFEAFSQGIEK